MANLSLIDVTKTFDDDSDEIVAVDNLNLEIQDGEFLVLVGPSGCGKSTTLRMVAGLETPTSGSIVIGDEAVQNRTPQERDIAMVFQSYALYPHMTTRENMSFGLEESTDLPADEIEEQVRDATDMMGISDLLDRKPGELSGGQQQRVALGRAIVRDPEVFLLDEPLSNLDAKLRAEMRTELQQLQEDLETTTVYVTHDQTEAMTMSDRIAILNEGKLQQVGTPMECYHEPANLFVAEFIGEPSMNFFKATAESSSLIGDEFKLPISNSILSSVKDRAELVLGIRPEDIEVMDDQVGDTVFPAVVEVVEPHGDENAVHLQFADQSDEKSFTVMVDGMRNLSENQSVGVRFPENAIHLFDAATGDAVRNRVIENVDRIQNIGTS